MATPPSVRSKRPRAQGKRRGHAIVSPWWMLRSLAHYVMKLLQRFVALAGHVFVWSNIQFRLFGQAVCRGWVWLLPQIDVSLCYSAIYAGTVPPIWVCLRAGTMTYSHLTATNPTAWLALFIPTTPADGWGWAVIAAVMGVIAASTFTDSHGYALWQSSNAPFLARYVYAIAAGARGAIPLLKRIFKWPPR